MKFSVLLLSALQSLRGNARRTVLTMLGIIIGLASVITIISLGNGFQRQTIANLTGGGETNRANVDFYFIPSDRSENTVQNEGFTAQDRLGIELLEGVHSVEVPKTEVVRQASLEVRIRDQVGSYLTSVVSSVGSNVLVGESIQPIDSDGTKKVAVISEEVAVDLYGSSANAIGKGILLNGTLFYVKGVKNDPVSGVSFNFSVSDEALDRSNIEIPHTTYEELFANKQSTQSIKVYIENGYEASSIAKKVKEQLQKTGAMRYLGEYVFTDMGEIMKGIGSVLNGLTYFVSSIAGISLFIAGVGVMNMMYISVSERTKEIGIRRSMGATKQSIQMQFLLEGVMITSIGGFIGYVLGVVLAKVIAAFLPFDVHLDVSTILLALGISTLIGIVFSVFPAKAAANKDVIEILR